MSDFSAYTGWAIPEGNVVQVADASGVVLWMLSGDKIVLEVEKTTAADTYAGGTTYQDEQFILLDIYPKTNGTVSITYGGLTKTITDTSGAEEPNSQQVYFGTFNGISDSVATPASGELVIEGDYYAFGCGVYPASSKNNNIYTGITKIVSFGKVIVIPHQAFGGIFVNSQIGCLKISSIRIPNTVKSIGSHAFTGLHHLKSVVIPSSVTQMVDNPFIMSDTYPSADTDGNLISVPSEFSIECVVLDNNNHFRVVGNCFIEVATNKVIFGTGNIIIPAGIKSIGSYAFYQRQDIPKNIEIPNGVESVDKYAFYNAKVENVTIPASVISIGMMAFYTLADSLTINCQAIIPPTISSSAFGASSSDGVLTIVVPAGCGEAYKAAEGWSDYADYIVEAS